MSETTTVSEFGYWPLKFRLEVTRFDDRVSMWRVDVVREGIRSNGLGLCSVQVFDDGRMRLQKSRCFGQREETHEYREVR